MYNRLSVSGLDFDHVERENHVLSCGGMLRVGRAGTLKGRKLKSVVLSNKYEGICVKMRF